MNSSMQEFTLSRDGAVKGLTALAVAICVAILIASAGLPILWPTFRTHTVAQFSIAAIVIPFALFVAILFVPWSYGITDKEILIRRWGPNVHIPFDQIESVEPIEPKALGRLWKIAGNGGLLGYVGSFRCSIGMVRMYTTRKNRLVLIRFRDGAKPMLLSPDDRDRFVDAARAGLDDAGRRSPDGGF